MKTINLSYPETSEIKFESRKYPDGQQDIIIDISSVDMDRVIIKSRFNSFSDLELILCATAALGNIGIGNIDLFVPYLLGARSDRKFVDGSISYLVQVIAPILNAQCYKNIYCIDVHSNVAPACIQNLCVKSNMELVGSVLYGLNDFIMVSPDAGSKEKVYAIANRLTGVKDIIVCSKRRDIKTGNIISTDVGNVVDLCGKDTYVIDDICDGGRTFIEISKKLKQLNPGKINLVVTHGIFSNGFGELNNYFDRIFCTNSVKDIEDNIVTQVKII